MGSWTSIKKIEIDGINYHITGGRGFPCFITARHTFINNSAILLSNIQPDQLVVNDCLNNQKILEAKYPSHPIMIVFYSYLAPSLEEDILLCKNTFLESLHCPYVLGIFNHCGGYFHSGLSYMESKRCLSLALFNQAVEAAIEIAIHYVHKTKRIGALLVGKDLCFAMISKQSDQFLALI